MPLHLLGKKSWNVYNPANVSRVRRDEADARAREDAAEQRMQQQDAETRMALLRGETPPALPALTTAEDDEEDVAHGRGRRGHDEDGAHGRKRRRLRGEDDTDREMRFAREDAEAGEKARRVLREEQKRDGGRGDHDDVPLQDREGHIQLVPVPEGQSKRKADEKDDQGRRREKDENKEQEQQGLRFTDAAGYQKGTSKPWYASSESRSQADSRSANELMLAELQGRDVWGNEDPRRKEREQSRITSSDPFAMMQRAQKQLKRSETDREEWRQERDREVKKLKHEEERRRRHDERRDARRSRRRDGRRNKNDEDELEGFSLDGPTRESSKNRRSDHDRHHRRHRHSHHRRERSRSRSREHRRK